MYWQFALVLALGVLVFLYAVYTFFNLSTSVREYLGGGR